MDISREELDFLKSTLLNHKLGLVVNDNGNVVLNYEEQKEEQILNDNYFGLEEVKELHINPKEKNNHLLIEGDNYYALKALQVSGIKVDVIYIDPPYNTGNKDFVYNDDFVEKNDQFKHSKWLSFMKKRLELARELLADDGVIFVSIDDNEQAYLKVLMDEIFGEENFITNFLWQTNNSAMKVIKYVRNDFEYILCYSKIKNNINSFSKKENKTITFENPDNDPNGPWFSSNATYKLNENNSKTFEIKLPNGNLIKRTWRFTKEEFKKGKVSLYFSGNNVPRLKIYKKDYNIEKAFSNLLLSIKKINFDENDNEEMQPFINFFESQNFVGSFQIAKNELKKIGVANFDTPKSTDLIKFIINLHTNKNSTILDFFAGSETTAQVVMELNEEDGGNRRFILCTNNENNIAQDICRERIYRVINGEGSNKEKIDWEYSKDKKSLNDNSMKYLKVKPIHNVDGEYEDINDMKKLYKNEFNKDLSIKDFR